MRRKEYNKQAGSLILVKGPKDNPVQTKVTSDTAFTFSHMLIYYIYAVATPDGTVLSMQEARRENSSAWTPCFLKLVSI